jgi:hypothetical protein
MDRTMDRPLCESCIHWDKTLDIDIDKGGFCQIGPSQIWKAADSWCGQHHRFHLYLKYVEQQELKREQGIAGGLLADWKSTWVRCAELASPTSRYCPSCNITCEFVKLDDSEICTNCDEVFYYATPDATGNKK